MTSIVRCYVRIVSGPAHLVISIVVFMVLLDVLLDIVVLKVVAVVVCKFVRFLLFGTRRLSRRWCHWGRRMAGALRLFRLLDLSMVARFFLLALFL